MKRGVVLILTTMALALMLSSVALAAREDGVRPDSIRQSRGFIVDR